MGRGATKAAGNPWYQARIEAAKWVDKLSSRAGAAEMLGMSEDAVKDTELGLHKHMPVEHAVLMADLYNAPELEDYYCMHECPIGRHRPLTGEVVPIERVTLQLMKMLKIKKLDEKAIDILAEIAEDGVITKDEIPALQEAMEILDEMAKRISEVQIIAMKAMNGFN